MLTRLRPAVAGLLRGKPAKSEVSRLRSLRRPTASQGGPAFAQLRRGKQRSEIRSLKFGARMRSQIATSSPAFCEFPLTSQVATLNIVPAYKFTPYFENEVMRKRPYLTKEMCVRVIESPIRSEAQDQGLS